MKSYVADEFVLASICLRGSELAKRYQPQQQSTPSVLREPNAEDE
jgi:hypothetical protein